MSQYSIYQMKNIIKTVFLVCLFAANFVKPEHNVVLTFSQIVAKLRQLATSSLEKQTFTDAAYLVNNLNGEVLYKVENHVTAKLESGEIFYRNPFNHGGRQVASWYWENKHALSLPEPKDVTFITPVDNCLMCTGSILVSGFNVGTLVVFQGITTNSLGDGLFTPFKDIPEIHNLLMTKLGYYKIEGDPKRTAYSGGLDVLFKDQTVSVADADFLRTKFSTSFGVVLNIQEQSYIKPQNLLNLQDLDQKRSLTIQKLKQIDINALTINVPVTPLITQGKIPAALKTLLENKAAANGAENAVAVIDPFGNLLLTQTDTYNESPLNSAFFNIVMKYYDTKYRLISQESVKTRHGYKYSEPYKYLSAARDCHYVFLNAPGGLDPISLNILAGFFFVTSLQNIGFPKLVYINNPIRGTIADTEKLFAALPSFFAITVKKEIMIKASIV